MYRLVLSCWCFLVLAGLVSGGIFLLPLETRAFEDRIIAVVNKDVITWSDLQEKVQDEYKRLKAKYKGEDLNQRYVQKQREVLNNLIDEHLQLQEAKAKGFAVTQEEIDAALRRTPRLPNQTEQEYANHLLLQKLFDFEVRRTVVVEAEELRRYYETNPNLFRKPPKFRLKQILVAAKEDYERGPARKKADTIHAAWKPGMDLTELAAQFFEQVDQLGWVQEDELLATLSPEVKHLKPGELSRPIETALGFHLLTVEEVSDTEVYQFEEVEQDIRTLLHTQKTQEAYQNWLAELKHKAFIEVKF